MAITQTYVDPVGGSDATGDGSSGTPWKTLQHAFDTLTRNTTDGNQVNLKATGAHVNAAALDLTMFIAGGALAAVAPLILRGYTAAANDGGIGEIDCNGATMWAATTYDYIQLADLEIHNGGNNDLCRMDDFCMVFRCELHRGVSTPSGKNLLYMDLNGMAFGCYIHDTGATGTGININGSGGMAYGNYVVSEGTYGIACKGKSIGNIVLLSVAGGTGIYCNEDPIAVVGNAVYNTAAGTGSGISLVSSSATIVTTCMNNILCGFIGAGGEGVNAGGNVGALGFNGFWNNTATYTVADQKFLDLSANDVALAADPFVNAAAGDFSLTAAGKAALRGLGWPGAYLGAHANTDGHVTIGPVQYGEAPTGYPSDHDVEEGVTYGESSEYTGVFGVPAEDEVEDGVGYGAHDTEFEGTLAGGGGAVSISPAREGMIG